MNRLVDNSMHAISIHSIKLTQTTVSFVLLNENSFRFQLSDIEKINLITKKAFHSLPKSIFTKLSPVSTKQRAMIREVLPIFSVIPNRV